MDPSARSCRRTTWLACVALAAPVAAAAATPPPGVRGQIILPPAARSHDRPASFWPRLENGVLPIGPAIVSPMADVLVVLEGSTTSASWSGSVVLEAQGADFIPRTLPVLAGTTVELKNADRMTYTFYSPDHASFF